MDGHVHEAEGYARGSGERNMLLQGLGIAEVMGLDEGPQAAVCAVNKEQGPGQNPWACLHPRIRERHRN